jgi:2-amino-4-hydroxy-6-hydroxymethyldihydropteridine diphosphokinase
VARRRLRRSAGADGDDEAAPPRVEVSVTAEDRAIWRPSYVAIGSNLDDPVRQVREAFERLAAIAATRLVARSRLYATKPLGPQDQPDFINAAAGLVTRLSARQLLDALLEVERTMGRHRAGRWGPRIIDLDLIWQVGPPIAEPDLCVPHPGVSARNFVLYPLADIAPTMRIPGMGTVLEMRRSIDDAGLTVLDSSI